jgi:glycosyltransferase involved in cell wall biosynthesis
MSMKVSVIIPLYNKKNSIVKTLLSVINQSVKPLEIIVVNDGSTDGSEILVEDMGNYLIKLIHQRNQGVSAARNKGIENAKGDWISFLDADDIWFYNFLETGLFLYNEFPGIQVIASSYLFQDIHGSRKQAIGNKIKFNGEYGLLVNYFEVASYSHPPICSNSIIVKKDTIKSIGCFPVGINSGEDLITWAKLAVKHQIVYCRKPLSIFIQDSAYTYNKRPVRIPQNPDIIGEKLKLLYQENPKVKGLKTYISLWHKMRASSFVRLGFKKSALNEIIKSIIYNPLNYKIYVYFFLIFLPKSVSISFFRNYRKN